MFDEFSSYRNKAARRFNEQRVKRIALRDGQDTEADEEDEDDEDFIEYTVQFLVDSKKEEVAPLE